MNQKELTPEIISRHLMMHSAYWQKKYKDSISDLITPANVELINDNINSATVLLEAARKMLKGIEYAGQELTVHSIPAMYYEIDKLKDRLKTVNQDVNKTGLGDYDLNEYPIN